MTCVKKIMSYVGSEIRGCGLQTRNIYVASLILIKKEEFKGRHAASSIRPIRLPMVLHLFSNLNG